MDYYDPSGYCTEKKELFKRLGYTEEEAVDLQLEKYTTAIDDAVTLIEKDTTLRKQDVESFLDGKFRTVVTDRPITVYRAYGGNANMLGSFVTTNPVATKESARESLALLPSWGNTIQKEVKICIPKGTRLNIGKVAPQEENGRVYIGGADQIKIMDHVMPSWVIEKRII